MAETCRVVGVSDGDTIAVRCGRRPQERVRIAEIDAPERGQPFGKKAKDRASELSFGKDVELESTGRDRYGRTLGRVRLPDGTDFGREMIKSGYAWRYVAYSKDETLTGLENMAKAERRGMWADPANLKPWKFRQAATKAKKKRRRGR